MIFKQVEEILNGTKTQTRRVVKHGDCLSPDGRYVAYAGRVKWRIGQSYAVCPKRGQSQIARVVIGAIRQEHLWDISAADAKAEGIWRNADGYYQTSVTPDCPAGNPVDAYQWLWMQINTRVGVRWEDNPLVWVIEFKLVQ
jgi:hypothetical protein